VDASVSISDPISTTENFLDAFRGRFTSVMRWHQLDEFWDALKQQVDDAWYIYAVGETPPESPTSKDQVLKFIDEIDVLLHKDHDEDYCGIVYIDNKETPAYIKIFDPNNLGVSCGFSDNPPLPGWILSKLPPVDLEVSIPVPGSRRRWWQRLSGA
jgi:hypothetical protein